MGWANCGTDSRGRNIGYAFPACCDHPGCNAKIDRGLSYACGGMHGNYTTGRVDWECCEGYFCTDHLYYCELPSDHEAEQVQLCLTCVGDVQRVFKEEVEELLIETIKQVKAGNPHNAVCKMARFLGRWDMFDDLDEPVETLGAALFDRQEKVKARNAALAQIVAEKSAACDAWLLSPESKSF